ncbi:Arc family DNA-binding protein [Psychrobacter sanguinis]|uniref:Arc family DNA-binding protein n=1 Tax=Psychrobacter sanguinis TaxID=861445 RepID=UPI0019192F4A|nr:Arc family DNA-binding protein [Psychrobacter sanguinis]MCC3344855.1 Arc family DNA-binding protein [Psychrobacter sanguinis]
MANVQFNLRVPEELKQKIDKASQESGRSINAEATYRLEQSFAQGLTPSEHIEQLEKQLTEMQKVVAISAGFFESLLEQKDGQFIKYFHKQFPDFENKKD